MKLFLTSKAFGNSVVKKKILSQLKKEGKYNVYKITDEEMIICDNGQISII